MQKIWKEVVKCQKYHLHKQFEFEFSFGTITRLNESEKRH